LQGVIDLRGVEDADEMIRAIDAWLVKPADQVRPPESRNGGAAN
jgi:hypothetical protein